MHQFSFLWYRNWNSQWPHLTIQLHFLKAILLFRFCLYYHGSLQAIIGFWFHVKSLLNKKEKIYTRSGLNFYLITRIFVNSSPVLHPLSDFSCHTTVAWAPNLFELPGRWNSISITSLISISFYIIMQIPPKLTFFPLITFESLTFMLSVISSLSCLRLSTGI